MATLTDGMVALVISSIATYLILYTSKDRLWRIIGGAGLILIGLSAVMIDDTVPMMVYMGIHVVVGGIKIFEEVSSLA